MKYSDFTVANTAERRKYVARPYEEVPLTIVTEGSLSHLISTEELTVSFLTMKANSTFELHSHSNAQLMIVTDGYCDEIINDKIYRLEKGDVIYLPPGVVHGAFIRDTDCVAIDIFSPGREDYLAKFYEQNPQAELIFTKAY